MSSEKPFAMDGNATDTADNATNAADNATDAASPQRQLHATEQNSTSAEPELTDQSSFPNVQTSGFCSFWQKALFVDITRSPLKSFRTPLKPIESSLQRGAIVGCIIYRTYLTFIIRTLATHVGESPLTFAGVLYSIGLSNNCHVCQASFSTMGRRNLNLFRVQCFSIGSLAKILERKVARN